MTQLSKCRGGMNPLDKAEVKEVEEEAGLMNLKSNRQTYIEIRSKGEKGRRKKVKKKDKRKQSLIFWNVHRTRRRRGKGKKSCGEWIRCIRSIFGFESDPSERVYPVRPITGTSSIVPQISLSTARLWIQTDLDMDTYVLRVL